MNTQWPLCFRCSKSWQVSKAGGFLRIRGGQQQREFVPGAAPQWWIAGPFLWHCWQGALLILTCPYQLTRGKNKKTFFSLYFFYIRCLPNSTTLHLLPSSGDRGNCTPLTAGISWPGDTFLHTEPSCLRGCCYFCVAYLAPMVLICNGLKFFVHAKKKRPVSKMFCQWKAGVWNFFEYFCKLNIHTRSYLCIIISFLVNSLVTVPPHFSYNSAIISKVRTKILKYEASTPQKNVNK